jgi:hypothetical protein
MDEAEEALRRFVDAMERAGVAYMLTGSFASGYYSRGRATQDIDFVVNASREQLQRLLDELPSTEFYVDAATAMEALKQRTQFNAIDRVTAYKADFIIQKLDDFNDEEFQRRVPAVISGVSVSVATAEDVIIAKLEWAKLGESELQIRDVAEILKVRGPRLDFDYIIGWVERLGLEMQWTKARIIAGLEG